ncbi:MAG: MurR/RpiR family transcriptional regulator [Angelakisella sp.]
MTAESELFTLMSRIDGMSNQFTKTDWKIVQFIKNQTDRFLVLSAQELAKDIGASDASVIRFAQKVGYSGLNEMKYAMQRELNKVPSTSQHSDYSQLLRDNKLLIDSLFSLSNPIVIDRLRQMMREANRIFIVGVDFNCYVAEILAHKFVMLGLQVQPLTTYDTLKLYSSLACVGDLFITISLSGNHKMLSALLGDYKKKGSRIALVSNYEKSLCSSCSDLLLQIPKTDLLQSSAAISREVLILLLFDMVFHNFLAEDEQAAEVFKCTAPFVRAAAEDDTRDGFKKLLDGIV